MDSSRNRLCGDLEVSFLYLKRRHSIGEFYSIAVTNNYQQADTGTKMVHLGKIHEVLLSLRESQQGNHKIATGV